MSYVLISVSGKDRVGIVRDVTEALMDLQINIEDSSMTALRGQFTMMLIVHLNDEGNLPLLKTSLAELEQRTGLTMRSQAIDVAAAEMIPNEPDTVITVAGADKIGIVYAVSCALGELGCSIVDMSTQSRVSEQGHAYFMALEVDSANQAEAVESCMSKVAQCLGVDIAVHGLEQDRL